MKILVADDDIVTKKMLASLLTRWEFTVLTASTGSEAWQLLLEPDAPDLVLLDWQMPGMDGVDICRQLRQLETHRHKYIILLTSRSETDDIVTGLQAGADDYLTKPFDKGELHARISVGRRTLQLQQNLAQSLQTIEETMQRLQANFLWGHAVTGLLGCSIAVDSISYEKTDGDFYDFYTLTPTQFDLVIGDVMGKGMIAALLGSATTHSMARAYRDLLAETRHDILPTPQALVQRLSAQICPQLYDMESFVTLFYCRVDLRMMQVTYVDCGHPEPLIYNRHTHTHRSFAVQNSPIGFLPNDHVCEDTMPIMPGDLLLFYSDGISEARNSAGEMFGEGRLQTLLEQFADQTPGELVSSLNQACQVFVGETGFSDDATCIVIRIEG